MGWANGVVTAPFTTARRLHYRSRHFRCRHIAVLVVAIVVVVVAYGCNIPNGFAHKAPVVPRLAARWSRFLPWDVDKWADVYSQEVPVSYWWALQPKEGGTLVSLVCHD